LNAINAVINFRVAFSVKPNCSVLLNPEISNGYIYRETKRKSIAFNRFALNLS